MSGKVQIVERSWPFAATKVVGAVLTFALYLTGPSVADERADLPSTPAGRCATSYFDAFNSGKDEIMQAFEEEHRALSYLRRRSLEQRVTSYGRLRGIFGQLSPVRLALSLELQLTLLVDAEETDDVLVMRFQLEAEPPHRLAYLTFSGIDHSEVDNQYVDYVATRAAPIDDTLRERTVESVAVALRDNYVYPELGEQMASALLKGHSGGQYEGTKAGKLADMLTETALAVSNDRHVWVAAQNPMVQESTDPVNRSIEELRRDNYDFQKIEVLAGNIGYIKFDMIHDDEEALEIAAAALDSVARCEALIFDIRDNIGGEWGVAQLMLGYLVPRGTVYGRTYDRNGDLVEARSTLDSIPGKRFGDDVIVYVLTSSRTGSAAEGFAYTLKHLGRATIVGEVTRGMAHPSEEVVVNDYFRVSVPFRRSENVVTKTDWEGTGVTPQIKVTAERGLETAVEDALRRIGSHE